MRKLLVLLVVFKCLNFNITLESVSPASFQLSRKKNNEEVIKCGDVNVGTETEISIDGETYWTTNSVCLQGNYLICLAKMVLEDGFSTFSTKHCKTPLTVQEPLVNCADPTNENIKKCSKIVEATFWNIKCSVSTLTNIEGGWINMIRVNLVPDSIGEFFWFIDLDEYGVNEDHNLHENEVGNDCAIIEENTIIAVPCDEPHKKSCAIRRTQPNSSWRCSSSSKCVFWLNQEGRPLCLCIRDLNINCNAFLPLNLIDFGFDKFEPLALPISYDDEGIFINESEFKWIRETLWSSKFQYDSLDFQRSVLNSEGFWEYGNSSKKICSEEIPGFSKSIKMKYLKEDLLEITTDIPIGKHIKILSDVVPFHQMGILTENEDYEVVEQKSDKMLVKLKRNLSGYFLAQVQNNDGFKFISSDRVFTFSDERFILKIAVESDGSELDPLSSPFFRSIEIPGFKLNWMKTLEFDSDRKIVRYLVHIYSDSQDLTSEKRIPEKNDKNYDFVKDFNDAKLFFREFVNEWITIESSLQNLQFCDSYKEFIRDDFQISWPVTYVNKKTYPLELCRDHNLQLASLTCNFDYYDGANFGSWDQICYEYLSENENTIELEKHLRYYLVDNSYDIIKEVLKLKIKDFNDDNLLVVADILDIYPKEKLPNVINIFNEIMRMDTKYLIKSQKLNTANRILEILSEFQKRSGTIKVSSKRLGMITEKNPHSTYGYGLFKNDVKPLTKECDCYPENPDFKISICADSPLNGTISVTFMKGCALMRNSKEDPNDHVECPSYLALVSANVDHIHFALNLPKNAANVTCARWMLDEYGGHWEIIGSALKNESIGTCEFKSNEFVTMFYQLDENTCEDQQIDCNGTLLNLKEMGSNIYNTSPLCIQSNKLVCLVKCENKNISPIDKICEIPLKVQEENLVNCLEDPDNKLCRKKYETNFENNQCLSNVAANLTWKPAKRISYSSETISEFFNINGKKSIITEIIRNNHPLKDCLQLVDDFLMPKNCSDTLPRLCQIEDYYQEVVHWCPDPKNCYVSTNGESESFCICKSHSNSSCNENIYWKPVAKKIPGEFRERSFGLEVDFAAGLRWVFNDQPPEETFWDDDFLKNTYFNTVSLNKDNKWIFGHYYDEKLCLYSSKIKPKVSMTTEGGNFVVAITNVTFPEDFLKEVQILSDSIPNHQVGFLEDFKIKNNKIVFEIGKAGHYWAELFDPFDLIYIKSNVLFIETDLRFILEVTMKIDESVVDPLGAEHFTKLNFPDFDIEELNWMKTLNYDPIKNQITYLVHLFASNYDDGFYETFAAFKKKFAELQRSDLVQLSELKNLLLCDETVTLDQNGNQIHWPVTNVNETSFSTEICADSNHKIVSRKCHYDFYKGAHFEWHRNCIILDTGNKDVTNELANILNEASGNASASEIIADLTNLTHHSRDEMESVDVFLISEILTKLNSSEMSLKNFSYFLDHVVQIKPGVLFKSQQLNSTDKILDKFEEMQKVTMENKTSALVLGEDIIVSTFDVKKYGQIGVALLNEPCETYYICVKPIFFNTTSVEDIKDLKVAAYLPNLEEPKQSMMVSITFYITCSIFNDVNNQKSCAASGISVILDKNSKEVLVKLIFKTNAEKVQCGYWNYGSGKYGQWDLSDDANTDSEITTCEYLHTTNYAILFSGEQILGKVDNLFLDIYTIIGTILTCFSTAAIYLTAILFENWRRNTSNKALMHYTTLICVQVILLYVAAEVYGDDFFCSLVGACLHYVILAEFMWSLMFASVQYQKLVKSPLKTLNRWNKVIVICYMSPLLPVAAVLIISPGCYINSLSHICYPSGSYFYFALLLPMALVLFVNIVVFLLIGWELFAHSNWGKGVYVRCATLLTNFMILGFTWSFAIYGEIFRNKTALYIFTIMVNFQGFFIFLKFILLRKHVRRRYARYFNQKLFQFGYKK